ncbi:MAG: putative thiosulfate sulfurtransferase [Ilumatobacteraceae bacterium]|nr:putative thiosulfate sulfurtransferase [Ilumatobacteraceae bacterium]
MRASTGRPPGATRNTASVTAPVAATSASNEKNRSAAGSDIVHILPAEQGEQGAVAPGGWHDAAVIPVIVDAAFVAARPDCTVVDVRWYLDGSDGRAAYLAGHLPGAVWCDLETQLATHDQPATEGRHPFPTPADFARSMSALGIGDGSTVIAYDDTGGVTAGRLVVMLRMLGHDAAMLDGGLHAWTGPVDTGWVEPAQATFTERPWPADRLASADQTGAAASAGAVVLDARSYDRFTGEVTQIDPRPGHVPGARSAPWADVIGADSRVRPVDELRAHYSALGVDGHAPVIAYCGSGVSACVNIMAIEHAGFPAPRLYVASWSGWSSQADRPAELGDPR